MKKLLIVFIMVLFFPILGIASETTTGGVTFADTLGYTKPAFYPITYPSEADCGSNVWYVDLSSGSGSSCTSGSPCSWSTVASKGGVGTGGPARIYIKGTGALGDISIVGSAGNEVVVKPWNDSTTATINGRNNWSGNKQHLIFDGGPNMQIRFVNNGSDVFSPVIYFDGTATSQHEITWYRTRWSHTGGGESMSSYGGWQNLYFINNEFTGKTNDGNQHQQMYFSGYNGSLSLNGLYIYNNIFRDVGGEALEFRVLNSSTLTNVIIDGNAWHNIGKGTCSSSWKCRSPITLAPESGTIATIRISNNLIWDVGENCVRTWGANTLTVYNNTCYNWGMGTPANGAYGSAAFANYSFSGTIPGTYRNNILYAAGSDANGNDKQPYCPGCSPQAATNNMCESGESCGTSSRTYDANVFLSVDENNADFFKLKSGSAAINYGYDLSATFTSYYFGTGSRSGTYDIGADEYGISEAPPAVPTLIGVTLSGGNLQ
jgi:hypothetical protein